MCLLEGNIVLASVSYYLAKEVSVFENQERRLSGREECLVRCVGDETFCCLGILEPNDIPDDPVRDKSNGIFRTTVYPCTVF